MHSIQQTLQTAFSFAIITLIISPAPAAEIAPPLTGRLPTPWAADAAAAQEIVLAVTDPSSEGDQPRGKQRLNQSGIWYTPVSGIWQTVWLEPIPLGNAIATIHAVPDVDAGSVKLSVNGTQPVAGEI